MSDPGPPAVGDGYLLVDKPSGLTSQQAVTRVKRTLAVRKAGHGGTLDPMATGLLVIAFGRATRLLGYLADQDKQYRATIRLGQATNSDDAEGEPVGERQDATGLTTGVIEEALDRYRGEIDQVPSAVSAIKVEGRRAYDLVREGRPVVLKARRVTISRFDLVDRRDHGGWVDLDVVVDCSTGTYIRALARDLGRDLAVGAHLSALRRTRIGQLTLAQASSLDQVDRAAVRDIAALAPSIASPVEVDAEQARAAVFGRPLPLRLDANLAAVFFRSRFLGLYRSDAANPSQARPLAVFLDLSELGDLGSDPTPKLDIQISQRGRV